MNELVWLIAIAVFLVIEIATVGLVTIWFVCGALVAFIASLLGANTAVQIVLFAVVSFASLFFVRPSVTKKLTKGRVKTNYESLIGQETKVVEEINNLNNSGAVKLNGTEWTARSEDGSVIPVGVIVTVIEVKGVKVFVKKKEDK